MPETPEVPALKLLPARAMVRVTRTENHAHAVPGTDVVLELRTGIGECADPGAGIGVLVGVALDGPTEHVGRPVFFDPYALDEGRNVDGKGFYIVNADDLYAVLLDDGTVQPLGKWILGEAVTRTERTTASGLNLPAVSSGEFNEERKGFDWSELLVGVMRVVALGADALPEFVGHEQRRVWAGGPCVYFNAYQNGADDKRRRYMNGKWRWLLTYAEVLGLSTEPVGEVKRGAFIGMGK